jgi:hypothetical protein
VRAVSDWAVERGWPSARARRVRESRRRIVTIGDLQIGKVVGATGFEPATPCAQGKLGVAFEVLFSEQFAASENSWAHFWDHPTGERMKTEVTRGD